MHITLQKRAIWSACCASQSVANEQPCPTLTCQASRCSSEESLCMQLCIKNVSGVHFYQVPTCTCQWDESEAAETGSLPFQSAVCLGHSASSNDKAAHLHML